MIAKCPCEHCGVSIEFATEEFLSGSSVPCPTCGKETPLSVGSVSSYAKPAPKPAVPATPPQRFTEPVAAYRQKSSMNFLPWIIVAALVVVSGLLGAGLYQERAQRILLESQLAAEEKLNSQAQKIATGANRTAVADEMKQQLADDQQAVRDAVAGIYEYERPYSGQTKVLDFRSDGSVVSYFYYSYHSDQPNGKTTLAWTSSKNSISVSDAGLSFRPEGDDLIDAQGNRWIRTH